MNVLSLPGAITNWWRTPGGRVNRRTPRAPSRRRGRSWLMFLFLVGTGLAVPKGTSVLWEYVRHHPYFAVSDIAIETEAPLSQEDLLLWSGLTIGMSVWAVDPEQVEARLLASPGVRTARVRREFPQRVTIHVGVRRPVAVIAHPLVTYLDETGVWFTLPHQQHQLDLPYVTGLTDSVLDSSFAHSALAGVLPLLPLATVWAEPLSEIHWDQQQGYTLFLAHRRLTIRLGWETTPEKFTQVGAVLARWPLDGPPALVDARFANQIVVRPYPDDRSLNALTPARPL